MEWVLEEGQNQHRFVSEGILRTGSKGNFLQARVKLPKFSSDLPFDYWLTFETIFANPGGKRGSDIHPNLLCLFIKDKGFRFS